MSNNNNKPLISVLLPVYNRQKQVKNAIKSILWQTYQNIELIIWDDGSTDKTVNVIKNFNDDRIRLYTGNKNKGNYYARNRLIELAKSNICVWQDSDDLSNIKRIELQYNELLNKYKMNDKILLKTRMCKIKKKLNKNYINSHIKGKPISKPQGPAPFASIMFMKNNIIYFPEKAWMGGGDTCWRNCLTMTKGFQEKTVNYRLYFISYPGNRVSKLKKKNNNKNERKKSDQALKNYCANYNIFFENQRKMYLMKK